MESLRGHHLRQAPPTAGLGIWRVLANTMGLALPQPAGWLAAVSPAGLKGCPRKFRIITAGDLADCGLNCGLVRGRYEVWYCLLCLPSSYA